MIDTGKYTRILSEGLTLDHYKLLCDIRDGKQILNYGRIQGFLNLLHKKGYIDDGVLSDKAFALMDEKVPEDKPMVIQERPTAPAKQLAVKSARGMGKEEMAEYADWVINLHRALQAKLEQKTGKKQVRDRINGVPHSFLPNPTDLGNQILKVLKVYKIDDLPKIEKCLLKYIDQKAQTNKWFPIIYYYIYKENASKMVTDMETMDEDTDDDDTIINL